MARTVVITFNDGTSHTYKNVPDDVTREQVKARVAREFSSRSVASIERLAQGAGPGEIPVAPTAAQVAAGATVPQAPAATRPVAPAGPPPSIGDQAVGALEALGTVGSAATTGLVSAAAGGFQAVAEQLLTGNFGTPQAAQAIEDAVAKGMAAGTYVPRTPAGQEAVGAIGEALQNLPPVAGVTGTLANASSMAGPAARQALAAGAEAAGAARTAAAPVVAKVAGAVRSMAGPSEAAPAGRAAGGSVGAAGVDLGNLRQSLANELPVPIQLTKGQRARTYAAQQAEEVLAKDAKVGDPIRQRYNDQRQQLVQNMDAFFDSTEAQLGELRDVGVAVDKTLRGALAKEKQRVRTLYKEAEKAGELEAPVTLNGIADFFNQNTAEAQVANVIGAARQKALNLGLVAEGADGKLVPRPVSLKTGELFRRSVNNLTNDEPTNIRFGAELKRLYDEATEAAGGDLYKKARKARREMAEQFELNELTRNLIGNKRGTADRAIAFEDVLQRVVLSPATSKDSLRHVGVLLKKSGSDGAQTWRELQGATIRHLQERALSNVARDERGTPIFSAAKFDADIKALDRSGKLDYLFGNRGAEQLRTLNEVAKVVLNPVPGTVNTSNTATTLAAMMDLFTASATGVPVPAVTGFKLVRDQIKDRKLRARVAEHLK